MRARVYRSAKREFDCKIVETGEIVSATALATLIKGRGDHIVVGDYVEIKRDGEQFVIHSVQERDNFVTRHIPREQIVKTTAANCDLIVIVVAVSKPVYKQGLVDRYLVRSSEWDIPSVLIFNKMDEFEEQVDLQFESTRLQDIGVDCYEICAKQSDYNPMHLGKGLGDLKDRLKGITAVFLGKSGVGKSKLISCLSDGEVQLKSRNLAKIGKGSHTTTWSEIIDCGEFLLIDSPGVRSFSVDDILHEDLIFYFPDLAEIARHCKFRDCQHLESTPGCAFYGEGQTPERLSRLNSYFRLQEEVSKTPDWQKRKG